MQTPAASLISQLYMIIPDTPNTVTETELMLHLKAYAEGRATWLEDGRALGQHQREMCLTLHQNLAALVNLAIAPILDRATSRELETFTMHDRSHGHKVAHLMWHILSDARRLILSPPEIALLVASAYLHDAGMALSPEDRERRFAPESVLWDELELDPPLKERIESLRAEIARPMVADQEPGSASLDMEQEIRTRAEHRLSQAREALLSQYTRKNHASANRYDELLTELEIFHQRDPERMPDIRACLSFGGDSIRDSLISICVSHNQDATSLIERDPSNPERLRFPRDVPIGGCLANLILVAGALRLADVLDFDRERTPPVLFHYLLPTSLAPEASRSVLEWGKHLSISGWDVQDESIIYRGRCKDHIIHHAIVLFAQSIEKEIRQTRASFEVYGVKSWPFCIPDDVDVDIREEGYRYVPYRFELDEDRVYALLMGGAIYENPLAAVRELIQNAVDACKLRDALTQLVDDVQMGRREDLIVVRYEEATVERPLPRIIVEDRGVGMDAHILEQFFLKVGRSYYSSQDFNETRAKLRRKGLDFAPVSDFGIGFLSSFMLSDRVIVETAMWEPIHGDTRKRTLIIDGPTRLIRLNEQANEGLGRFKGTKVTLDLKQRFSKSTGPEAVTWEQLRTRIELECQDLPFVITLESIVKGVLNRSKLYPRGLAIEIPAPLKSSTITIEVKDPISGLEGNIAITSPKAARAFSKQSLAESAAEITGEYPRRARPRDLSSSLLRGGFCVGAIPGLPSTWYARRTVNARLRLNWEPRQNRRYDPTNLSRTSMQHSRSVAEHVHRIWLTGLLRCGDELPDTLDLRYLEASADLIGDWIQEFSGLAVYRLARGIWRSFLGGMEEGAAKLRAWEQGEGRPLRLGIFSNENQYVLLMLVAHKITMRTYKSQGQYYLNPPAHRWMDILESSHDFLLRPKAWDEFAEYDHAIGSQLIEIYPGSITFNYAYMNRLTIFDEGDLPELRTALNRLYDARYMDHRASLTSQQLRIMRTAAMSMGDLVIGGIHGRFRIDSFALPEAESEG
jgi:hypothetical protein